MTLLCDAGTPRNAAAVHVHGFVTRDGVTPAELRRIGRHQLDAGADLLTPIQSALVAPASGIQAAGMLNHALTVELLH